MFGYLKISERLVILLITCILMIPLYLITRWIVFADCFFIIGFIVGGVMFHVIDAIFCYIKFKKIEW